MATSTASGRVRFGQFELDLKTQQLTRNGIRTRLSKQPIQVLTVLLERPGEIITREELQSLLWPADVFVDFDRGLNKSIQKLREALGDSPESPRYVETIPRTGYRFIAPVTTEAPEKDLALPAEAAPPKLALSDLLESPKNPRKPRRRWFVLAACAAIVLLTLVWIIQHKRHATDPVHSLAVLPLDNLTGDPGQDYFADGMTDELITMLAKDSTST